MSLPRPVRIYESRRAPNPRRVSIFLAEKGVEIPRVEVDIMAREHFGAEHMARAGAPVVPVLELETGEFLSETVAICRYVEALHPEPSLMGADALSAARIEMWQRRVEFGLLLPIAQVLRHTNPHMAALESQVPDWGEANRPRAEAGMRMLDARLTDSPYVGGEDYSIADITALAALDFMKVAKIAAPDDCAALADWLERVRARPSAKA